MTDRYWRKIKDVENDIENAMQISGILLKLKGYDADLSKIGDNENNISSNSGLISTNTNDISDNSGLISTNEGNISSNSEQISTNTGNISSNLSKLNNIENNLILVDDIYNETFPISRFSVTFKDNRIFYRQLYSNFTTNGIIKINAKYNYVYDENYTLKHVYRFFNNRIQFKKIELQHDRSSNVINDKFEIQGIDSNRIDIAIYYENKTDSKKIELVGINTIQINYIEKNSKLDMNKNNISSNSGLISTNTSSISSNKGLIDTNKSSISSNKDLIETNTSSISTNSGLISTNTSSISTNKDLIETNTSSISTNSGLINTNTSSISTNLGKINTNTSSISTNLGKINDNKDAIIALKTSNIKAFYNLDQIFIYDIENGYQTVNKDNHFHIFEKEITYDFIKNSYLEIALKVLTEISNYVLIGFFQILCNFYNQDNNLFYTISLSTAMGSINRLSTIKSVFIVPINENMSKIKIDFFIAPKETQQNRSAKFVIQDINSNKIYVKYFQKTEEMSIKDIQDSLDNVKNISNDLDKINNSIKLKNIKNILFYDVRDQINFKGIFFNKTFELNIKKNDFIEIDLRMLLDYENINEAHIVITEFKLYNDNDEQIYISTYNNGDSISYKNFVFINKYIFYNFEKDTKNLKIVIEFRMTRVEVIKIWYEPKNTDRFIIKHYGN